MLHQRITLPTADGSTIFMDAYVPRPSDSIEPDPRRAAVIIFPGGGYGHVSEREGEPVALRFMAEGFNTFVVHYRVAPQVRYPLPQQDAAAAIGYVRRHADELLTDPHRVAVMGFSAGGHLACSLGVWWPRAELWQPLGLAPEDVRPDAMVLSYPVITSGAFAHRGSFENLTGCADAADHAAFSLEDHVAPTTPPAFLWHTFDDDTVPVENTLLLAAALRRCRVPAEVHVFPHGPHGASLANAQSNGVVNAARILPDCAAWPDMASRFLRSVL